jgi:tetratricopeptide (TPR) repeat protein
MYRDITQVDRDQRALMQAALGKVYGQGDRRARSIALSAMKRLGIRPRAIAEDERGLKREGSDIPIVRPTEAPRRGQAPPLDDPGLDPNAQVAAVEDRPPDRQQAQLKYREGVSLYRARRIEPALGAFLAASDADPTWAKPLYLAATCYARMGEPREAVATLKQMKDINSDLARTLIRRAAKDKEFARVRRNDAFKSLTGAAVVQILNGAGSAGKKRVMQYAETLQAKGIPVSNMGTDSNSRVSSYLYAKPGFSKQAEKIRRVLRLGLVHKRTIEWPTPYDVILVYGKGKSDKWVDDEAEKSAKSAAKERAAAKKAAKKKKDEEEDAKAEAARKDFADYKKFQQMQADPMSGAPQAPTSPEQALPPP